jgi:hypothetical protein
VLLASSTRQPATHPVTSSAFPFGGRGPVTEVDLYDLNPLVTIVRSLPAGPSPFGGEAPTMFATGGVGMGNCAATAAAEFYRQECRPR